MRAFVVFGLLFLFVVPALAQEKALKVGDAAPEFEMKGTDGKTYKLSDFKGKRGFVIAWFPKAFTRGCTAQCKAYREHSQALREFDVAYFTASVDPVETNKEFAASLELDYPILSDPEKKAAKAFGVLNERGMASRVTFYVNKEGEIAYIDQVKNAGEDAENAIARFAELKFAKATPKVEAAKDE